MQRQRLRKVFGLGDGTLTFYVKENGEIEETTKAEDKEKPKAKRMSAQEENSRKTMPQGQQLKLVFDYLKDVKME